MLNSSKKQYKIGNAIHLLSCVVMLILLVMLSGCHHRVDVDPFQAYLDSLKNTTGLIISTPDDIIDIYFDGSTHRYEIVKFSNCGPVQHQSSLEEAQKIKEENQAKLKDFIGEFVTNDGGKEMYRIKGHDDLQYLIRKNPNGELSVYVLPES